MWLKQATVPNFYKPNSCIITKIIPVLPMLTLFSIMCIRIWTSQKMCLVFHDHLAQKQISSGRMFVHSWLIFWVIVQNTRKLKFPGMRGKQNHSAPNSSTNVTPVVCSNEIDRSAACFLCQLKLVSITTLYIWRALDFSWYKDETLRSQLGFH